ncbi:NUDIX hydrolase [Agrobacterium sp. NPDC089420]|uniref:NUDIX hydrolase n=1 Tax=Agrobacterium sp. NPDC089420 TaxID=3363918 RepID=UPI00384B7016
MSEPDRLARHFRVALGNRDIVYSTRTPTRFGALCVRASASGVGPDVLLVTSRNSGRWVIPKGRAIGSKKPHQVASIEAWEEAGVRGKVDKMPLGYFEFRKTLPDGDIDPLWVQVHLLDVAEEEPAFPERGQRLVRWFKLDEAASLVLETDLAAMLLSLKNQLSESSSCG